MFRNLDEMKPEEMDAELNELQNDPKSPYHDPLHFKNAEVRTRVSQLYAAKFPVDPALQNADEGLRSLEPHLEGLVQADIDEQANKLEEIDDEKAMKFAEKDLRLELGKGYEEVVSLAQGIVEQFATDEQKLQLGETGMGNDKELILALAKVGKILKAKGDK
jgi:hypothetical protein